MQEHGERGSGSGSGSGDLKVNRVGHGAMRLTEEEPALLREPGAAGA